MLAAARSPPLTATSAARRVSDDPIDRATSMSLVSCTTARWTGASTGASADARTANNNVVAQRRFILDNPGGRGRVRAVVRATPFDKDKPFIKREAEKNPEWAKNWIDGIMPDGVDRELEAELLEKLETRRDELFGDPPPGPSIQERAKAALAEDTPFPKNPNPIELPPLPDLRELAEMSNLQLTDEEIEDFTPKVHSILQWFGKLNEVDLDAMRTDETLYRDDWRAPLRPDVPEDFVNMDGIYGNAGEKWEKPFVKVPSVDKKEKAAAVAAESGAEDASSAADDAAGGSADAAGVSAAELTPELLGMQLLVGKVIACEKHPDAEKLYVETVDCGEPDGPRCVCSGLVPYMSAGDIEGKLVVVVANLKPRKMAGLVSAGMLLCANNGGDGEAGTRNVELLVVPDGAVPGERLTWGGASNDPPHGGNKIAKKRIWEEVQPDLGVNGSCEAGWKGIAMTSSAGPVKCASIVDGGVS